MRRRLRAPTTFSSQYQMGRNPFSAADPDGPAYDAMIAKDKRLRAEREAQQYEKTGATASLASKVTSIADAVLGAGDDAARRAGKPVAKSALKSAGRVVPLAGHVLDGIDAWTGYEADLKRGYTRRQAAERASRRMAPGLAGAAAGGLVAGPVGAAVGGIAAPFIKDHVIPAIGEQMTYNFETLNDPRRWPTRRLP